MACRIHTRDEYIRRDLNEFSGRIAILNTRVIPSLYPTTHSTLRNAIWCDEILPIQMMIYDLEEKIMFDRERVIYITATS